MRALPLVSVSEVARNDNFPLLALFHQLQRRRPARDNLSQSGLSPQAAVRLGTNLVGCEGGWLPAFIGAVKLNAGDCRAPVVNAALG